MKEYKVTCPIYGKEPRFNKPSPNAKFLGITGEDGVNIDNDEEVNEMWIDDEFFHIVEHNQATKVYVYHLIEAEENQMLFSCLPQEIVALSRANSMGAIKEYKLRNLKEELDDVEERLYSYDDDVEELCLVELYETKEFLESKINKLEKE